MMLSQYQPTCTEMLQNFLGGASQIGYTTQWSRNQSSNKKNSGYANPTVWGHILDVWRSANSSSLQTDNSIKILPYDYTGKVNEFSEKILPQYEAILSEMYSEGVAEATEDGMIKLMDSLYDLISAEDYKEVNLVLEKSDVSKLAPEYLVGLLRITSKVRGRFTSWNRLKSLVENELLKRNLDSKSLLIGL